MEGLAIQDIDMEQSSLKYLAKMDFSNIKNLCKKSFIKIFVKEK